MKGSFDKGWNFGCLQVCLSLPPTHPLVGTWEDTQAFTRSTSPFHYYRDKEKNRGAQRQRGGGETASGTPCPSLPPLIARALAESYRKGSRLQTFWEYVCVGGKKSKEGLLVSHDFTGPLMMQPPHPHIRGRETSRGELVRGLRIHSLTM